MSPLCLQRMMLQPVRSLIVRTLMLCW